MKCQGEITSIKSSRGKKVMTVALSPMVSLDELDNYSDQLVEFEIGLPVDADGIAVDAITGEIAD